MTTHSRQHRRSRGHQASEQRSRGGASARWTVLTLLLGALCFAVESSHAHARQGDAAVVAPFELRDIVEPIRTKHELPALAVAVVTTDGVEAIGFTGVRRNDADPAFLPSDRVHLGSCTKAMTATLAALLVVEGALRWDSTVGEVLGPSFASIDDSWRSVTLAELLRHTGGAPGSPPRDAWVRAFACTDSPRDCRRAFVQALLAEPLAQARGTAVYSNQGYAIVGAMMEQVTDTAFDTLITERLFAPLGIKSAGFGPTPEAIGHRPNGTPSGMDNPAAVTPAGRAHMTVEDWAKFIALHLRRDGGADLPLMRKDFDHLHSLVASPRAVQTPAPEVAPAPAIAPPPVSAPADAPPATVPPPAREGMALGWLVAQRAWGGRVLSHAGSNTLWYCVAWLAPDRGFAAIAVTNSGSPAARAACDEAVSAAIAWYAAHQASSSPPPDRPPADH